VRRAENAPSCLPELRHIQGQGSDPGGKAFLKLMPQAEAFGRRRGDFPLVRRLPDPGRRAYGSAGVRLHIRLFAGGWQIDADRLSRAFFRIKKIKIFFKKTGNRFSACYFLCNLF
jgi:hypothetical protein